MKARLAGACILALVAVTPAFAHRLDEYLQATTISLDKGHLHGLLRLTPGVAVFGKVLAEIDTNGDGAISQAEETAYADKVLTDLSLSADGKRLDPAIASYKFDKLELLKRGLGEIEIDFDATLPAGPPVRKLVFENHHQGRISAYLVNCLVPEYPIRVTGQSRTRNQSHYELDLSQEPPPVAAPTHGTGLLPWYSASALLVGIPFVWMRRRSGRRS